MHHGVLYSMQCHISSWYLLVPHKEYIPIDYYTSRLITMVCITHCDVVIIGGNWVELSPGECLHEVNMTSSGGQYEVSPVVY